MKLGVALPLIDVAVGDDPAAIREFAQTAEEIGYQDLAAPDHVLGVNVASRPDWDDRNTSADLFHNPFVLFGFLACTRNVEFSTQVLILAQRQAVLVAKPAASLDVLCGGRFRLGVRVGQGQDRRRDRAHRGQRMTAMPRCDAVQHRPQGTVV
jgi:alkanesulfonate monooxygenase SsuD/methylene tetrahydromethanopterin reductase-like flavin-dependent oxidoreductase (luciferase family)